tara:strand:- start:79 stop:768 length:690 start_codon:yes stop_codon:yes gene_type:complete
MKHIRRSEERGQAAHGWLKSFHSFSFADYYDPQFMGFRDLRVINQDTISGGAGFPTHGHKDMEILTYVTKGALRHKDSEGNSAVILPGEIQKMSAGSGIYHSEFNENKDEECQLLQIWILPNKKDVQPSYDQKKIDWSSPGFKLIATPEKGVEGAVHMEQDALVYACKQTEKAKFTMKKGRYYWIQVVEGDLNVFEDHLKAGDALAYYSQEDQELYLEGNSHYLLFDLN